MTVNLRSCLQISCATILSLASASLSLAQQAQPSPPVTATRTVNLSFIVVDGSDRSLDDVQKDEIRIFENKQSQTISAFAKAEKAVDYGIAIDTSSSFRRLLPVVVQAVRRLIENQPPGDECFIERFVSSDKIETVQEFTSDKALLLKDLPALTVEGGQSAVVDAVYVAVKHIAGRPEDPQRRKALVLFTDGEDRASYYTVEQLKRLVQATDVKIFIVGLIGELDDVGGLTRPSPHQKARELLKDLARESGGRVFFPGGRKDLAEALGEIFHDLHIQYELTYESKEQATENFRPVKIEIVESPSRKKVTVIARPGYYLTPPEPEKKAKEKKPKNP